MNTPNKRDDACHAHREAVEMCQNIVRLLREGEQAAIRALIGKALCASESAGQPLLTQLLDAADRMSGAWASVHDDVTHHQQALTQAQERSQKVMARLQGLLELALDTTVAPHAGETIGAGIEPQAQAPAEADAPVSIRDPSEQATHESAAALAPALTVYFLRSFQVEVNDKPVEGWPNCKAKTIFKYLVLTRERPATRDALMDMFWPEADPESARVNLNVALYNIRSVLRKVVPDFPFIVHDGGHYLLNRALRIWTDAETFESRERCASQLERDGEIDAAIREREAALELYRNELLAEDRYEEWVLPLREQMRDRYLLMLERLNAHYFARSELAQCVATCRRLLSVDSCNEEAHRQLMRCYARMGQPQLAQMQYRNCVKVLARELTVAPQPSTTQLYREIMQRPPP